MLTREAAGSLLTHAGPEIGVASTKAFTAQLTALALLALHLGRMRGTLSAEACRQHLEGLTRVPQLMEQTLAAQGGVEELSRSLMQARDFLYLGRGVNYPIALEGALKLKEISYVHAEGYPAGEMKHGPIALIDENLPVVALCPQGHVYEKMVSNVQEVKARGGRVIAVVSSGDTQVRSVLERDRDSVIEVPLTHELWSPFAHGAPLAAPGLSRGGARGARRATSPATSRSPSPSSSGPPLSEDASSGGAEPGAAGGGPGRRGSRPHPGRRGQRQDPGHHPSHRAPRSWSAGSRRSGSWP